MIAVAIVGVFLTAVRLGYLWWYYQTLAAMHASKEAIYVRQLQQYEHKQDWAVQNSAIANLKSDFTRGRTWERLATQSRGVARDLRRLVTHESRVKREYERAARHPWLPIAPDLLEPE